MLGCARFSGTKLYRVEVSGWNSRQNFFVENCDLLWSEETGKRITVQQKLHNKAILFVRLLEPGQSEPAHPVVYEAEWVGAGQDGSNQFRLQTMVPRLREQVGSVA